MTNIPTVHSDHTALHVSLVGRHPGTYTGFRFENSWLLDEGFREQLLHNWQSFASMNVTQRLSHCGHAFMKWGHW